MPGGTAPLAGVPPLRDAGLPTGARGGFSTRAGGAPAGDPAFTGLNLGDHVGDDADRVRGHRDALRRAVGAHALVVPQQVHGSDVAVLDDAPADVPVADALVTRRRGLALAVVVADCVPVLLADPAAGVVAVAHAGRPGLVAGVVPAVVAAARAAGARHLVAVLGPAICGSCYEVPAAMADGVTALAPAARSETRWGTPGLDVAAGVVEQLRDLAVPVRRLPGCTAEDAELHSYRRDGRTGRSAGVVVLA